MMIVKKFPYTIFSTLETQLFLICYNRKAVALQNKGNGLFKLCTEDSENVIKTLMLLVKTYKVDKQILVLEACTQGILPMLRYAVEELGAKIDDEKDSMFQQNRHKELRRSLSQHSFSCVEYLLNNGETLYNLNRDVFKEDIMAYEIWRGTKNEI